MPISIDVSQAQALLSTRADLLARGGTERGIRADLTAGSLIRIRRDQYAMSGPLDRLWPEGRHLVEVVAVHRSSATPGPVFWGPSAAVLHGLPLYRTTPKRVHTAILGTRRTRTRAGVTQHDVELPEEDIVEVGGIRCTSVDRTVLDLACTASPEAAVAAADAALRRECVRGHHHDREQAQQWHARMAERAQRSRRHGIRRARSLIAFADGRAELPGESVSRLVLHRLGFREVQLQVPIRGSAGNRYWADFGFPGARVFGEFDGQGKYLDEALRGKLTVEQVVLQEKRREDDVRGVTGWRFARWEDRHIRTIDRLGRQLAAFGLLPPG
ncbi:hypothetical protein [Microbacterium panaciterrae]|uniref:Transcriptional regulator, AbiEi antitoxin, Type IV TA system n=1 Tax=Microbacterium panaciterrae TaxID=985759 RepID=A0ABP8PEY1_9MICO